MHNLTHAIEPEKEEYLKNLSIPWIEVNAEDIVGVVEKHIPVWTISQPMPNRNSSLKRGSAKWFCAHCSKLDKEKILFFRVVDMFYPEGKRYRALYLLRAISTLGNPDDINRVMLTDNVGDIRVLFQIQCNNNMLERAIAKAQTVLEEHLQGFKKKYIVDDHMRWHAYTDDTPNFGIMLRYARKSEAILQQRYYWLDNKRIWILDKYTRAFDWNVFIENRDQYEKQIEKYRADLKEFAKQKRQHEKYI